MVKKVETASAQRNVDMFLRMLGKVKRPKGDELVVRAWVKASTGKLQFEDPPRLETKEWQPLEIRCKYDRRRGLVQVEKTEGEPLHLKERAAQVVAATFSTFSNLGGGLSQGGDFASQLDELSKLAQPLAPISDERLILAALYEVDRGGAEKLLQNRSDRPVPTGTYLFRQDHYAQVLEDQLVARHPGVRCLTVTIAEGGGKFSDYTLVHCSKGWQIYNDDPSLEQPSFPSLQSLLSAHKRWFLHALYKNGAS
jgi:hypothetical protein